MNIQLKDILILIVFSFSLPGCDKGHDNKKVTSSSSQVIQEKVNQEKVSQDLKPVSRLNMDLIEITKHEEIAKHILPRAIKYQGTALNIYRWFENDSDHYVIVSFMHNQDHGEEIIYEKDLNLYVSSFIDKGDFTEEWSIHDFNLELMQDLNYLPETFKVVDIDGDGVSETEFFYILSNEPSISEEDTIIREPYTLKYILHSAGKKLVISGKIPRDKKSYHLYEKNIDPKFDNYPPIFKEYASKRWDIFVENKYFSDLATN